MKPQKELIGATTRLLILSVLAKDANYGYQIIQRINEEAGGVFTWQEGTVYPVLHKLEKEGLVRTQWQQADTGRERKYYYITAEGRDAQKSGAEEWNAFHAIMLRFAEEGHV